MKIGLNKVRQIIKEELMAGVPEFQFRNVTSEFVEDIRRLLRQNILLDKSKDSATRQRAFVVANAVLKELEKEVSETVEEKLRKFNENT